MAASQRSLRGLDWFAFFVADVQTGFGPFVSVYLTTEKWTQVDIGLVLSVSGVMSLIGQIPGGALLDAARSERLVAAIAVGLISASAVAYAAWPIFPVVFAAACLHAAASCLLGPAIVAMSLGLVGPAAIGERLGRNARFASIGAGLSAAVMGACGYLFETRSVFLVTAALLLPTWAMLRLIAPAEIDAGQAHGSPVSAPGDASGDGRRRLSKRPLVVFAGCILLFHLANAAMLPLLGSMLTMRTADWATVLIAACMVGPQIIVALCSPWIGRQAQRWGRRPILLVGLAALPLRGLLFATVTDPYLLVLAQLLDGVTATVFSVMVPLTIADLTRGTGHFNLTQGMIGTMMGIGASLSTPLAGYITDSFGSSSAFLTLASVALVGLTLMAVLMPETNLQERPPPCHAKETA